MILDHALLFCKEFAITSISAGSNAYVSDPSSNSPIDIGIGTDEWGVAKNAELGESGDLDLVVLCDGADFACSGSPAITIDLHASAASSMGTPDTLITFATDKTPNNGDVLFRGPLPKGNTKRYLNINVAVATAKLSGGKITAALVRRSTRTYYNP